MRGRLGITILHLSDLQFGKNHRFGRLAFQEPEAQLETLLERLSRDLQQLRHDHALTPDLVVISGDLTEQGYKQEFEDALQFVTELSRNLRLPPERVVLVPGNHDVNRAACESYFKDCESRETEPAYPFWPKWREFGAMFREFFGVGGNIDFTQNEPWTWYRIEDLKVAVAGLNSTMAEIHAPSHKHARRPDRGDCGHFGYCGEKQLLEFEKLLKEPMEQGWLRIGVMHHNPVRAPENQDDNLRDLEDFRRILVPRLNLVLHGHTHYGALNWVDSSVPVLSTGSTGVERDERPDEVPNQYQIIQIMYDRFVRWTRYYIPLRKEWGGDVSCSPRGAKWSTEHQTAFRCVHGALFNAHATFDCTEDEFVDRLAQADTVTVIGVSNEGLVDYLKQAWRLRNNRKWRELRIVFLARNLLAHVREPRQRPLDDRQGCWDQGVSKLRDYLGDREKTAYLEIRHSDTFLPFVGQLYDEKRARVAFILPERETRFNCYLNLSTQFPPCRTHGVCLLPDEAMSKVVPCTLGEEQRTCNECPRRQKNSPCSAVADTFGWIRSSSTPLVAANVVGHLNRTSDRSTEFCFMGLIPQYRWKRFSFPDQTIRPAHLVTFVLLRHGNEFLLLPRNETNARDQLGKLSVVSGRVNDEDFFVGRPNRAHREEVCEMQMAHYPVIDGDITSQEFWTKTLVPLARKFAKRVRLSVNAPIPEERLEKIGRNAAVRYAQEKLRLSIPGDRFRRVRGSFVVSRDKGLEADNFPAHDLFPVLFVLEVNTAERASLSGTKPRDAQQLLQDASDDKLTEFLATYADQIVALLSLGQDR